MNELQVIEQNAIVAEQKAQIKLIDDDRILVAKKFDALRAEINDLKQQLAEAHKIRASWVEYSQKIESGEFTLIENKKLTTWYLDEPEGMYWDFDGIDGAFSNLDGGQVIKVERLRNFTVPEVYVTRTWEDGDVGYWKEYATKEEAEKVAKHCKAMIEAVEKGHE